MNPLHYSQTETDCLFRSKFKKRAQHERQNAVEKAKRMITNPGSYVSAMNYGANQYVKAYIQNKETDEMIAVAAMSKKEKNRIEKLKKAYEENSSETAINTYTKYIETLELSLMINLYNFLYYNKYNKVFLGIWGNHFVYNSL